MYSRLSIRELIASSLTLVTLLGCAVDDLASPDRLRTSEAPERALAGSTKSAMSLDDHFAALAQRIPEFAGIYEDGGELVVALTDISAPALVASSVVPDYLAQHAVEHLSRLRSRLRFVRVTNSFAVLRATFDRIIETGWPPQATALDIDERANRVFVGIQAEAERASMAAYLASLRLPSSLLDVGVSSAPPPAQGTLADYRRPMLAGIQIQFGVYPSSYYVCTLGFNVYKLIGSSVDSTQRYFLTNSHCSQVRFAFDGGPYWQPDYYITTPADSIGSEVQDPPLFTGSPCPSGKQCRWSDVALIKYRSTTTWFHGGVAASTATQPPGPAPWNGWWTFHTNNSGQVNQTVYYKTGRTTGTTSGPLARTCYDFPFDGVQSGIILKCQYRVSAAGGGQDSGSPVYLPDYWAGFYALWPWGILHSADASQFVFSSTNGIAQDLGMNFYYLTNCGLIDPPICGS